MSNSIQPAQMKLLHSLLNSTKMMSQKETLVISFTAGRSKSSKDLSYQEARALITHLKSLDSAHKMRCKIIKLAHEIDWHHAGTTTIDMPKLNEWCRKYGYLKKELNAYTEAELPKLVSQFENGPYKHYLSSL